MKKTPWILLSLILSFCMIVPVSAADAALTQVQQKMQPILILMLVISAVLLFISVLAALRRKVNKPVLICMYVTTVIVLALTAFCFARYKSVEKALAGPTEPTATAAPTQKPTDAPTDAPTEPEPTFTPEKTEKSDPASWNIRWEIISGGKIITSYQRPEAISFGKPEDYFALPGISTFRGNNFRNSPYYGSANITEETLTKVWTSKIGSLNGWPGSGWTGQPLIIKWDAKTKAIMNLYKEKKAKEDLVEVIYATLDGNIYFYDLDDGSYTRDPLYLGMNFKGAGSIDPRGYPIMYVGGGDYINGTTPVCYIISLIDGKVLFERSDDPFTQRSWTAWDSSPLVDAETDTLIWPGESGILYTYKLNTSYDADKGTISVKPEETVKIRYGTGRSNASTYWIGFEPSAVIVDRYLYISENGGMFYCIDLNTMELVWAQDTRDDSNSTPVFEWDGTDGGYIYTAPSLHWTSSSGGTGYICVYKLNAKTGEIVWEHRFDCHTVSGVSGGVQATPILGKKGTALEGLVIYPIARTPNVWDGKLVAFDTKTGDIVWELSMDNYAWSSPLPLYGDDGSAHIVICDSAGLMQLVDAKGKVVDSVNLGSIVEASPAAYNNMIVVGTRGELICGVKVK